MKDGTGTKATADDNLVTFQLYALAHRAQQKKKQVGMRRSATATPTFNTEIPEPLQ